AHLPSPRSEGGGLPVVVLADRNRLVLLDGGEGLRDVRRVVRVIGRAGPVIGSPLRGRPLLVEGLLGSWARHLLSHRGSDKEQENPQRDPSADAEDPIAR